MHRQQAFLPLALKEQPLLRAVAQVALVVFPTATHALAQAEFFEQVLHFARVIAGHRQVVGTEWAGDAFHHAAAAVAASAVFEFEQHEVIDAGESQCARGGQARHAAASDHDTCAAHCCRRRCLQRTVPQRMAPCHFDAGEAALDRLWGVAAGERQGACGRRDEISPLQCATTLPHSLS